MPRAASADDGTARSPQLHVLVYAGEGAGQLSARTALEAVQSHLAPGVQARYVGTAELLEGSWRSTTLLLVMPGGADLPYCKLLNGRGNRLLRDFVEAGGSYLGLCAGAYYGCSRVEFEPGSALQVVGDRELGFFPGVARGAAYPGSCPAR
ncbi:Biotin--protein ligase [Tetrabaena socialis]|uniref:Biotin--protein ligase n=1 Tax=Tetrabaena socialis TaxID=47790 RepID=A0A2J8A633_9CHLO|nr:Biotin--protein ligase [Tetrabaena socialis]|eukprot:PNH07957.1 Biotin--protein ligase [Tetrabaena socialis]